MLIKQVNKLSSFISANIKYSLLTYSSFNIRYICSYSGIRLGKAKYFYIYILKPAVNAVLKDEAKKWTC